MFKHFLVVLGWSILVLLSARADSGATYYVGNITIKTPGIIDTSLYLRIFKNHQVMGLIFLNKTKTTGIALPVAGLVTAPGRYRADIVANATGIVGKFSGTVSRDKKTVLGRGFLEFPNGRTSNFRVDAHAIPGSIAGKRR